MRVPGRMIVDQQKGAGGQLQRTQRGGTRNARGGGNRHAGRRLCKLCALDTASRPAGIERERIAALEEERKREEERIAKIEADRQAALAADSNRICLVGSGRRPPSRSAT